MVHVEGNINPTRDVEIINTELIFADLEQIDRLLPNITKRGKLAGSADDKKLAELLEKIRKVLSEGKVAHSLKEYLSAEELKLLKPYNLLTMKPIVYAINVGQEDLPFAHEIENEFMTSLQSPVALVCAKLESEMMDMNNEEKADFIHELMSIDKVVHIPTLDDLISLAFNKV